MISIIVVGYNSRPDLKECLDSIFANSYKKFKVTFVDNASSDNSVAQVRNSYPQVHVIENRNTGYSGGNNVGIKKAIKEKSDYVFLLNPDTILDKDCLKLLAKHADERTILQPLILLNSKGRNTNKVNTSGNHLNFLGFSYCSDYKNDKKQITSREIPTASGAAMFIPIQIIKKIGSLEEYFFTYHEDVDFCWRARIAGYNIKLMSEAIVWHKYAFSKNKDKFYYSERNRVEFVLRNYQIKTLFLILPISIINEFLVIAFSILGGWFFKKLRASLSVILDLGKIIRYRKTMRRIVGDRELSKFLAYEISFSEVTNPLFNVYNQMLKAYWYLIKVFI